MKLILKKLIPFRWRRIIRNIQAHLRFILRNWIYQVWIWRYDHQTRQQQDLDPNFIAFIDDNATLTKDAFYQMNQFLQSHPEADIVYTDSDQINALKLRYNPYFKPDWDPYLFLSQNYFKPFYVARKTILNPDGSLPKNLNDHRIRHLPKILCHAPKPFQFGLNVSTACLPKSPPLISIIIPTKDGLPLLQPCIESLLTLNQTSQFEILIVNNNSEKPETHAYFQSIQNERIHVLDYPHPFNYSAINNFAVKHAQGEVLLLLNNDIEALSPNSLNHMLSLVLQKDIGIVGAKLLYPNQSVQHAGIVLGIDGTARHMLTGLPQTAPGYFGNLQHLHCCSAVTAACLMIEKALYEQIGGLDENAFPVTFNDIDLCLKVRASGQYVVMTPEAQFYHKESATRGEDLSLEQQKRVATETQRFKEKWHQVIDNDPFYNPNLSLNSTDYALAFPPRKPHSTNTSP